MRKTAHEEQNVKK